MKARVDAKILLLQQERTISKISALTLKGLLEKEISINPVKKDTGSFYSSFVEFMKTKNKPNTRQVYESTLHRIEQYEAQAENMSFEKISIEWLEHFNSWLLSYCKSANSRSIHFRNIRSVFNYAIKHKKTDIYPFAKFKIESQETKHRCLTIQEIRKLWDAETLSDTERRHLDTFNLYFASSA